jgi:hypothetical protein
MGCSTVAVPTTLAKPAVPTRPKIVWVDDGNGRVSITQSEAAALARYINEVDGYIAKVEAM